jgi:integrase
MNLSPQRFSPDDGAPGGQHAPLEEYDAFLRSYLHGPTAAKSYRYYRNQFVRSYPHLEEWFAAPLAERIGRLQGETVVSASYPASYRGRGYLFFLAFRGYARFDWDWLLALPRMDIWHMLAHLDLDLGIPRLAEHAVQLGYVRERAIDSLRGICGRIFLHTALPSMSSITTSHLETWKEAIDQFEYHPDIALFYGSAERYHQAKEHYTCGLHLLHVLLYHSGQISKDPHLTRPRLVRRGVQPRMEAVVARFLQAHRLTDAPKTLEDFDRTLHDLMDWLAQNSPQIETWAVVTRDHLMAFAETLDTMTSPFTGRRLAALTKRGRISKLSVFFKDVTSWGWDDVPGRPLLHRGDIPKMPQRLPRSIPDSELARLMEAIHSLACPHQRAALLIARWSGARRDEIQRLSLDCLDSYPDGTPRLRIPAGKTYQERQIPLHDEAAAAIRTLQKDRKGERGLRDRTTGVLTPYLFLHRGRLYSIAYLFKYALHEACAKAGLMTSDGLPAISAHRFRHTIGTHLAKRKAKLRTIMKILGHTSVQMSLHYIDLADTDVLEDYQAVVAAEASIAGPAAEDLRSGKWSASDLDWLKSNFFKTELELGHCLRMPQEGSCECDLYLTCAKFVTTSEYAPRLRHRLEREHDLIQDASARGWQREVERHQCTIKRLEQLLIDLGEPLNV